jgi:hypothetical protein
MFYSRSFFGLSNIYLAYRFLIIFKVELETGREYAAIELYFKKEDVSHKTRTIIFLYRQELTLIQSPGILHFAYLARHPSGI